MYDLNSNLSTLTDHKTASLVARYHLMSVYCRLILLNIFLQINIDFILSEGGIFSRTPAELTQPSHDRPLGLFRKLSPDFGLSRK